MYAALEAPTRDSVNGAVSYLVCRAARESRAEAMASLAAVTASGWLAAGVVSAHGLGDAM